MLAAGAMVLAEKILKRSRKVLYRRRNTLVVAKKDAKRFKTRYGTRY